MIHFKIDVGGMLGSIDVSVEVHRVQVESERFIIKGKLNGVPVRVSFWLAGRKGYLQKSQGVLLRRGPLALIDLTAKG